MARHRNRARLAAVDVIALPFVLVRSAYAATREPVPTPRHARHQSPRSPR